MTTTISTAPIPLDTPPPLRSTNRWFGPLLDRVLGLPAINEVYGEVTAQRRPQRFIEDALAALNIDIDASDADVAQLPRTGPLVVVANHPFGALDGLVLASLVRRVRPDVKLLANHLLEAIPQLAPSCIFVDPFGAASSTSGNVAPLREAIRWVKSGGALIVFPAGEVSHWRLGRGVTDPRWNTAIARLIRTCGAAVVPAYFSGRNSALFHAAGLIHPRLRTALLPRELMKQRGRRVLAAIGSPIDSARLSAFAADDELIAYLRTRVYLLAGRAPGSASETKKRGATLSRAHAVIADAVAPQLLASDVAALPSDHRLASSGDLGVYLASADQIPHVLTEIGRLREIAFRHVGEGTGQPLDLDRFDQHYRHLFVWNERTLQIIGAYRLGLVDEIVRDHGQAGLYTSTLFRFRPALLKELGNAIELGRSFVRVECQKEFAPLMLLWKGIGQFVVRNPRYRRLFGPVSISNEYHSMTRWLLMAFLKLNNHLPTLARFVLPTNPPRLSPPRELASLLDSTTVRSMDDVGQLVHEIEAGRRSIPVLLRQYLKLNAKLLGFNVDRNFGDALDALMLVDLEDVDRTILARYLGREGMKEFLRAS